MDGLHLIGDMNDCQCDVNNLLDVKRFQDVCLGLVAEAGLTTVDYAFHGFAGSGYTGTVVLAESHLAIHTWPEHLGLTLDVYVCNYSIDNSSKARKLFDSIIAYFQPRELARTEVDRGQHLLVEPLNKTVGSYIKEAKQLGSWTTPFQQLEIYQTEHYGKIFRLDGFNMTSEKDEFLYHEPLVHPMLVSQYRTEDVLVIGGGDGGSTEEILKYAGIKKVTLCEIDADVIAVAKQHFQTVHRGIFKDERVNVIIADGMKHVRETSNRYNAVILDLNDPVGPAAALYSEEFFRDIKNVFKSQGSLSLHLGSPTAQPERVSQLYRRLKNVFVHVNVLTVYIPLYGALWAMAVCSDARDLTEMNRHDVDAQLERFSVTDLQYYTGKMHEAMFTLPPYLERIFSA